MSPAPMAWAVLGVYGGNLPFRMLVKMFKHFFRTFTFKRIKFSELLVKACSITIIPSFC